MRYGLKCDRPAFAGYDPSLRTLESSFRKAGVSLTLEPCVLPEAGGRMIFIRIDGKVVKSLKIEGDSPAQAVKDVAAAVRL
jgi:hypothetical protein